VSSVPDHSGLPRFAVVDLETTGLQPERHRILQIGLVVVDADGTVLDEWSTYVALDHWWRRLGPRHVHGIRRRDLRGAPSLAEALRSLTDHLAIAGGDAVLTAHHAAFDLAFLERAASTTGVPLPTGPRLCTLRLSRSLDPDRRLSHRLGDLGARHGVVIDRPHDAAADALATAQVLPHLLRAHGIHDAAGLQPHYERR
jgi:DNA polymerase-3 subunit epsilon